MTEKQQDKFCVNRQLHVGSVLEIKNFHSFVLARRDEDIVAELRHGAHKVFVLRVHREKVVSGRGQRAIEIVFTL